MRTTVATIICSLLIISSVNASWKIPLLKESVLDSSQTVIEELHYADVELGKGDNSKKVKATFDSTILFDWFLDVQTVIKPTLSTDAETTNRKYYECKSPCKPQLKDGRQVNVTTEAVTDNKYINGYRAFFQPQSTTWNEGSVVTQNIVGRIMENTIEFGSKQYKDVKFLAPNSIRQVYYNTILKESEVASFGVGRPDYVHKEENFADRVNKTTKLQELGFSHYVHDTIPQFIFGEPENFFGSESPQRIRNLASSTAWQTRITKILVGKQVVGSDSPKFCQEILPGETTPKRINFATSLPCDDSTTIQGKAQPVAVFDTTTRYIYGPKYQLDELRSKLIGRDVTYNEDKKLYEAVCTKGKINEEFPEISIWFYEVEKPFKLKGEDYVFFDDKKSIKPCWLLFRPNTETAVTEDAQRQYFWYLGTSFFQNNYCHFKQQDNSINCAPAFRFTPQNKWLDESSRAVALVVGGLILVAAIGILLSVFTKVPPFQPSSTPSAQAYQPSNNVAFSQIVNNPPQSQQQAPQPQRTSNIYNSRAPAPGTQSRNFY